MSNPILNENTFINEQQGYQMEMAMTKSGVALKTAGLLMVVVFAAILACLKVINEPQSAQLLMLIGVIGGFITLLITVFKRNITHLLAPVYAIFEGLFVGVASMYFESMFPGIVLQAVLGTFAVFFTLLALYSSRLLVVTQKVRMTIISATFAVFIVYFVAFLLSFVHIRVPFLYDNSLVGIGVGIVITVIAAANFLIDFDNIERGVEAFAPKYYEWYCSLGLLVTLVWVYIEILKLIARFAGRRR